MADSEEIGAISREVELVSTILGPGRNLIAFNSTNIIHNIKQMIQS